MKSFIRLSILNVASLILLACKLRRGVRIYVNYRGINKILLKDRYFLPLIKKKLNIIYKIK